MGRSWAGAPPGRLTAGAGGTGLLLFLICAVGGGTAQQGPASLDRFVGGELLRRAAPGDSLTRIGARFGEDPRQLARANGLPPLSRLSIGQTLRVDNRHIVPLFLDEGILINVPQRLLYVFREGAIAAWYPVAVGRPDWQTATGQFLIDAKRRDPTWHVPASIQEEMRLLGQPVRSEVPPGPANPLGDYWMGLTGSPCGIHSTIAPASIYAFRTHGCIRLHPKDMKDLYSRVALKAPVWIVYEPVLLARGPNGGVFLEVNADIYHRAGDPRTRIDELAAQERIESGLDEDLVSEVLRSKIGLARRVDRQAAGSAPEGPAYGR